MQSSFFPTNFLDEGEVAFLLPEQKLLLAGALVHHRRQACGVITLTDAVLASLSFLPSVGRGVAAELDRRGLATYDDATREFLVLGQFAWNLAPAEVGEDSPWAKNIRRSLGEVRAPRVGQQILVEITAAPAEKKPITQVVGNLMTALPRRKSGQKWAASELLVLLCLYSAEGGLGPGVLVVDFDALGGACSLPSETAREACIGLAAGGAIFFDEETHETLVFPRLRAASKKEVSAISATVPNLVSRKAKMALKKVFSQSFGKNILKSDASRPAEEEISLIRKEAEKKQGGTSAASESPQKGKRVKTKFRPHASGIACWDDDDVMQAEKLAAKNTPEALAAAFSAAVEKRRLAGNTRYPPAPGEVKCQLLILKAARESTSEVERRKKEQEGNAPATNQDPKITNLIGKTLVSTNSGEKILVEKFGAKVSGKTVFLHILFKQFQAGQWRLAA